MMLFIFSSLESGEKNAINSHSRSRNTIKGSNLFWQGLASAFTKTLYVQPDTTECFTHNGYLPYASTHTFGNVERQRAGIRRTVTGR